MKPNTFQAIGSQTPPVILVVDDCQNTCTAIKRDLQALGCVGVSATTVLDAIKWLHHPGLHPKIALIDLFFGRVCGLDVLDYLVADHPNIYRVLISGCVQAWQLELALTTNRAQDVLTKPWSRAKLARVVGLQIELP